MFKNFGSSGVVSSMWLSFAGSRGILPTRTIIAQQVCECTKWLYFVGVIVTCGGEYNERRCHLRPMALSASEGMKYKHNACAFELLARLERPL